MDQKSLAFNEGQLKRVGMSEAFTDELQKKMKQGIPIIQQEFVKKYEGDQVNVTMHLKKSPTSDYYFLNKFDMQVQREGHDKPIRQTFYVSQSGKSVQEDEERKSRHENKYTLKEAYNLLSGRPVFKNLVTKEGEEYQAWIKVNQKNVLANGNYELKQYTKNYGFELDDVLKNYPIKELTNEQDKRSMIESLHRGNQQKVTFLGRDGGEESLYISPSINTGSLNVYDLTKKHISLEKLVEKDYISIELVEQLKQRFSQQQKPEQSKKQELTPSEPLQQKQAQSQKQTTEKPAKKQTPKHKIQ